MRRLRFILVGLALVFLAGCSVYDVLFGMFQSNYDSASPDRASRYFEMQNEVDRWEARDGMMAIENR